MCQSYVIITNVLEASLIVVCYPKFCASKAIVQLPIVSNTDVLNGVLVFCSPSSVVATDRAHQLVAIRISMMFKRLSVFTYLRFLLAVTCHFKIVCL